MTETNDFGGVSGARLKSIIDRVERLTEEKKGLQDDIKDIFVEGKSAGFDPAIIKIILKHRKKAKEAIQEEEELVSLYKSAIGMA